MAGRCLEGWVEVEAGDVGDVTLGLEVGGMAEFCHVPHGARTGAYLLRGTGRISEGKGGVGQPGNLTLVTMILNPGMDQT